METIIENEKIDVDKLFQELLSDSTEHNESDKLKLISDAFELAYNAHNGVLRKSGEPYIIHPLAVATIVSSEIGLGTKSIVAAILHDVVEDTEYTLEDIKNQFGETIASLVDGLTKLSGVLAQDNSMQAENFKKLLLTLGDDIRVILIKIADRLHNMRTLSSMPPNKQYKIASETMYLFAPLAHRLGLYEIKTELEELSFEFRHPEIYNEIKEKLDVARVGIERLFLSFVDPIRKSLDNLHLEYEIQTVIKSVYSIWRKMQDSSMAFDEIDDLFSIRIVFTPDKELSSKNQCWNIYSIITDNYSPKPERIRDWISNPKGNGYQALHLTVMGPEGRWVEIQIRTREMHEIAEHGFASYWRRQGQKSSDSVIKNWLTTVQNELDKDQDALEFVEDFRSNLFSYEIMVFTPKGHLLKLPEDSTVIDFAYEVHSQIGDNCIGAKVNYKLVPRNHVLNSGDRVEIITLETQKPEPEWLDFAITAKAKSKIKEALRKQRKEYISSGKQGYENILQQNKIEIDPKGIKEVMTSYSARNHDDFFFAIGVGLIVKDDLIKVLRRRNRGLLKRYWQIQFRPNNQKNKEIKLIDGPKTAKGNSKEPFHIDDKSKASYNLANCCNPIPGDDVIAFAHKGKPVVIHKKDCSNATDLMTLYGDKLIDAKWTVREKVSFLTKIRLKGADKMGMLNQVTRVISEQLNVNMKSLQFDSNNGIFEGTISIYVHNTENLNNLILNLMKIKGIDSVYRID
ncbi:MAG: RelA/SpoT family protein [Bacteroidales bacterium]|nr:RelA/SpoT family protein [Bacteroidales bacterium]MCF8455603.1 RelA/SpoT family protein [Bacteroidales bacterium]